jgi:hypothetical protein
MSLSMLVVLYCSNKIVSAQRVLTNVAECCNVGKQGLTARYIKL